MIDWLEIRRFAIADHVEVEFGDRFTTVTGETGSGKSLIVNAINVLTGRRSDSSHIRHEEESAELQAGFILNDSDPALDWLRSQGVDHGKDCIVRRVLRRGRPSRGFVNGCSVTVSQLKDLGNMLVDVHGQNEHHSLLRKSVHLTLLDDAAGNADLVVELANAYNEIQQTSNEISRLFDTRHTNQERHDLLRFQISELEELNPEAGEWTELEKRHRRVSNQKELISGAAGIYEHLYGNEETGIYSDLQKSLLLLEPLCEHAPELNSVWQMMNEAQINIEESAKQLIPVFESIPLDAEEMEKLEKRLSRYHDMARKFRTPPEKLNVHLAQLKKELGQISDPQAEVNRLQDRLEKMTTQYRKLCIDISANRKKTALRLEREITGIMQELGMQGGKFHISLMPVPDGAITRYGAESVEFMVTTNPGLPLGPLGKIASGGELSRISLAIQVVLASRHQAPTLIFDEVDVGISGKVASVVGQKLRELGERTQIICITHLSQVAASGNHQLSVSKTSAGKVDTSIRHLSPEQRIVEIAKMTSGKRVTEQTLAHAREMLRLA